MNTDRKYDNPSQFCVVNKIGLEVTTILQKKKT